MRCRDGRRVVTVTELTIDGSNQCAVFSPGHIARPHGDDVTIYNGDNEAVAHFPYGAAKYQFLSSTGGHLGVFRTGKDEKTSDSLAAVNTGLASINAANAAFWKPKEEAV